MRVKEYIKVTAFCTSHDVDRSLLYSLWEYEIIQIELVNQEPHLIKDELPLLEKMLRLHKELEINPEGLQAIHHLLEKVNGLQNEIGTLRKKLDRLGEY